MDDDPFPSDFVIKFQPGHSTDENLFPHNDDIPTLQVKFHESTRFLSRARDDVVSPDQQLLLTSMEDNEELVGRTPSDEFERLAKLEHVFDVYFPGDRWVIDCDEMSRREILKEITESVERQKALKQMVDDAGLDIRLYPVIPGWEPWHFEHCRELFEVFDTHSCAFDGTEYDSKIRLWNDLEDLVNTLPVQRIYLNGRVSPNHLIDIPDEVVAFSGKKSILEDIKLSSGDHSRLLLTHEVQKRVDALHNKQTELTEFIENN